MKNRGVTWPHKASCRQFVKSEDIWRHFTGQTLDSATFKSASNAVHREVMNTFLHCFSPYVILEVYPPPIVDGELELPREIIPFCTVIVTG